MTESKEPDEQLLARAGNVLAGVQSGQIEGIMCVCFMANGTINVEVAGNQSLVVRLGALVVASDALKVLETQLAQQRQQLANWGPGGTA
jgi:hypothetical protein